MRFVQFLLLFKNNNIVFYVCALIKQNLYITETCICILTGKLSYDTSLQCAFSLVWFNFKNIGLEYFGMESVNSCRVYGEHFVEWKQI